MVRLAMMYKNKEKSVAEGIMGFADALILQHHADETKVLTYLAKDIKVKINLIEGNDSNRTR